MPAPEVEGWQAAAVAYLFDLCPSEHRTESLLAKHPVVLARITRDHVHAGLEALRASYGKARAELKDVLDAAQIEEVLAFYEREGKRLRAAEQAVDLIGAALHGKRFTARL